MRSCAPDHVQAYEQLAAGALLAIVGSGGLMRWPFVQPSEMRDLLGEDDDPVCPALMRMRSRRTIKAEKSRGQTERMETGGRRSGRWME